mmetsp:Transcript_33048/g.94729  ORF Transcript_33048/g.94729 Transcript_33048/m.94729 type:complete len:233 (-) Transcript_33048:33-731(-)
MRRSTAPGSSASRADAAPATSGGSLSHSFRATPTKQSMSCPMQARMAWGVCSTPGLPPSRPLQYHSRVAKRTSPELLFSSAAMSFLVIFSLPCACTSSATPAESPNVKTDLPKSRLTLAMRTQEKPSAELPAMARTCAALSAGLPKDISSLSSCETEKLSARAESSPMDSKTCSRYLKMSSPCRPLSSSPSRSVPEGARSSASSASAAWAASDSSGMPAWRAGARSRAAGRP